MDADKAAAVAVLHSLHENYDATSQEIELWHVEKHSIVVATTEVAVGGILLPPCVPKQSKVAERTEHPHAVRLISKVMFPSPESVQPDAVAVQRERTFWVLPEFKIAQDHLVQFGQSQWTHPSRFEGSDETMHPFWAVRRMTKRQLAREVTDQKPGKPSLSFNCELKIHTISAVTVGLVHAQVTNRTRLFEVPFLSNKVSLLPGEELILEIDDNNKQKEGKKRTWRDSVKDNAKKKKQPRGV